MLFARPHQAKQVVSKMNGKRIFLGIRGIFGLDGLLIFLVY
jgi:hypothetical protein